MTMRTFLLSAWEWKPAAIAFCLVLLVTYGAVWRFKPAKKAALFGAGWALLFLTLTSPLHALSDDYLFSAHMVMHLILLMVVPLLFVCSLPIQDAGKLSEMSQDVPRKWTFGRFITQPLFTWAVGLGAMWGWHQPALFQAAHENPRIHELQIATLLIAGCLFWWPIAGPQLRRRLSPLPGVIYLFTACLGCTILGIGITFARTGLFSSFYMDEDPFGIRPLLRGWGLTPDVDQQLGGLFMWVPPCLIYASGVMVQLMRLYRGDAAAAAQSEAVVESPEQIQKHL